MELGKIEYDSNTKDSFHWLERYLVVRSDALAHRQQKSLHQRLDKAEQALSKLAAKSHQDHCVLHTKVKSILKRYRVTDYFLSEIETETVTPYAGPGRPSSKDKNPTIVSTQFQLKFERQLNAIAIAEQLTGWRIYVTNVRVEQLSLTKRGGLLPRPVATRTRLPSLQGRSTSSFTYLLG
ncbi:MAG: hypothetical protein QNJ72_37280 [Pleurocapsa sp. MO_226.B13]|nr:hypothetical protein [Pleurocapsa sp. MO_226.B13]